MASIKELLMEAALWGDAFIKAEQRKDVREAEKIKRELLAKTAELNFKIAEAKKKTYDDEQAQMELKRQAEAVATQYLLANPGDDEGAYRAWANIVHPGKKGAVSLIQQQQQQQLPKPGLKLPDKPLTGEAKTAPGILQETELQLRGQAPQDSSKIVQLPSTSEFIQGGLQRELDARYKAPPVTRAMQALPERKPARRRLPAPAPTPVAETERAPARRKASAVTAALPSARIQAQPTATIPGALMPGVAAKTGVAPPTMKPVRRDLAVPAFGEHRGGVSRTYDLPANKTEERAAIQREYPSANEIIYADWVVDTLKVPAGFVENSTARLRAVTTAQKFEDDQRVRSRNKKIQAELDGDPKTRNASESLLRTTVNPTAARDQNMVYGVFKDLKRLGFGPDNETLNEKAYGQVQQDILSAKLSDEDKRKQDMAKMKDKALKKELAQKAGLQAEFDKFSSRLQAAYKLIISIHPQVSPRSGDLTTEIEIARMLKEKGWIETDTLNNKTNKKIASEVAEILSLADAEQVASGIRIDNPVHDRIANRVILLYNPKEAPGVKKYIQGEFARDAELRKEGIKANASTSFGQEAIKANINTSREVTAGERINIANQENAIDQLNQVRKLYQSYLRKGGSPNLYTRFKAGLLRTTGVGVLDRDLNEMLVRIDKLYFDFRKNLTGAAFSPTEANQYRRLFPEISMNPDRFFSGLDAVQNTYNDNIANFYGTIIGKGLYEEAFGRPEPKRTLDPTEAAYKDATNNGKSLFDFKNIVDDKLRKLAQDLIKFDEELPPMTEEERRALIDYAKTLNAEDQATYDEILKNRKIEEQKLSLTKDQFNKIITDFPLLLGE